MIQDAETYKELKTLSPLLASLEKVNPFSVPDHYFESNAANLFNVSTSNQDASFLQAIKHANTMQIPDDYFQQFPDTVLKQIQQVEAVNPELHSISPLIASIPKTNTFSVSSTYFDESLNSIYDQTIHNQTSRVVSVSQRFVWTNFAAAATLLFMMAFGAFYIMQQRSNKNEAVVKAAMEIKTDEQFETLLAQVNETDLIHYLQMSTDVKDAETILSMVNSDQLPEEADYLNTEFTEIFLNNLNTNVNRGN